MVCLKITFHDDMTRAETLSTARGDSGGGSSGGSRPRRKTSNGMLSWRVASNSEAGSDTFATDMSGGSYGMKPIKVATSTEQVTWFDRNASGDLRSRADPVRGDEGILVVRDDESTRKGRDIADAV